MSLLIKDMDMPKLDENAEHLWVPGWLEISKDGKAIFCTGTHFDPNTIRSYAIKEVPTPHGRLIDADELLKNSTVMWDDALESYDTESIIWVSCVKDASTIIEAEEQ